jgi:signal transduction histidine kinase
MKKTEPTTLPDGKKSEMDKLKTEFVGIASHQLRTPLATINWYVEMLRSEDAGKLNDQQKQFLTEVYTGIQRMVRLVNNLLNVSRIESGHLKIEPKLTQMEPFIKEIIHELEPLAMKNHSTVKFKEGKSFLPPVAIDATLIRQVIHNFLTNAIRYSMPGDNVIDVALTRRKDSYVVSVSDEGIGIPKAAQSRIFEHFYRADNAREHAADGSGLGLYLAKMIMETAGGKIWFKSPIKSRKGPSGMSEGFGTTFYASIPVGGMMGHEGERRLAEAE